MAQFSFRQWLQKTRESRILVLIVVTVALFVDCILNTVIAPILPTLLIGKNTSNSSVVSNYTFTLLPDNSSKGIYQLQNANGTQDGECYTKGKENSDGQDFRIGLLLAFKGMLQIVANPIVGVLTNRFGYDAPLLVGFAVVFFSTLMYAFGEQYVFLCVARGLQGIGSSLTTVPGLALLANTFPDDEERAKAMAISTSGLTVGILLGAPFGSLMNGSFGKSSPFYVLAAVTLLDGALRLCILRPSKFSPGSIPATPYLTLLADPYILVTVVGYFLTKLHSSLLQAIVPIRMMEHMCAPSYQLGLAFVPAMLTTILTLNGFAILSLKWGRWLCLMLGFIIQGIGIICFPLAANIFGLIGPSIVLGIGTALVGASIMPLMAYLIDLRHTSVYGGIYAITDAAFCLGFAIGPLFGGAIASAIGFTWVMVILCVLLIIYAPLFILLRNVSGKDEKKPILNQENTPEEAKSDDQ
uniref:Chromaffin granule amine transporter n=1 Tax=Xenopus tropicalis TaxID=8364 RepID=A0A6I8QLV9_XENTR